MPAIKEIRILEPKIKEVKKEKVEDKKNEDEEDFSDEEFADFEEIEEFVQERPRAGLRRIVSSAHQGPNRNLEAKMSDVENKDENRDEEKKKDFYKTNPSDFYGDSKKVYTGAGDRKEQGYDAVNPLDNQARDKDDPQKKKYVLEERRDTNPFENTHVHEKKHRAM